jgi:hypothetical protein
MLASTAAYAIDHTIHLQCWEENKNGQVYRHCEVKRLTDAAKPFWFPRNIGIAEQEPQAVVPQASPPAQEPPQDIPPTPPVAAPPPSRFNPAPMIEHYPSQFTPKAIEDMNRTCQIAICDEWHPSDQISFAESGNPTCVRNPPKRWIVATAI